MCQIYHFNPDYLYITITYITKLLMQCLRLNETCRIVDYSLLLLFDIEQVHVNFIKKTSAIHKQLCHICRNWPICFANRCSCWNDQNNTG